MSTFSINSGDLANQLAGYGASFRQKTALKKWFPHTSEVGDLDTIHIASSVLTERQETLVGSSPTLIIIF